MKRLVIRDYNIALHFKGEISLSTRRTKDKTVYNRKEKHKTKY